MAQHVRDVMTANPIALQSSKTVRDAAVAMRDSNVGSIVVTEGNRVTGIVTDRDIVVRCVAEDAECTTTPLSAICSRNVTTLSAQDELDRAVELMRERAIRRLPVVEGGKPIGILSLGDLAQQRDPNSVLGHISHAAPNR